MRIYVAHNYGKRHGLSLKEYEANVYQSMWYGIHLIKLGHNPYIPNMMHFVSELAEGSIPEPVWLKLVSEWLRFCDALLVATLPSGENSGVQVEIEIAKALRIPIYYSLEEIPNE